MRFSVSAGHHVDESMFVQAGKIFSFYSSSLQISSLYDVLSVQEGVGGVWCVSGESGDVTENDGFPIDLVVSSDIVPTNSDFCRKVDSSVE